MGVLDDVRRKSGRMQAAKLMLYILLSLSLFAGVAYFFWLIPIQHLQRSQTLLPLKDYLELETSIRSGFAQAIGGAAILLGLFFTWRNIKVTESNLQLTQETATRNLVISQEGQITERFTRAVEQLGNDKLQVRLGGIYALERISRDSKEDYWPVMEILTAFVRTGTPTESKGRSDESVEPPTDIQAVLNVVARRRLDYESSEKRRVDLRGANLAGATLIGCNLERAILWKTRFEGANLRDANLQDAGMSKAILDSATLIASHLERASLGEVSMQNAVCSNAYLEGAQLNGANLRGTKFYDSNLSQVNLLDADLTGASLLKANLAGAIMKRAKLNNADLKGADFTDAINLTVEQVRSALNYDRARLPEYLKREMADLDKTAREVPSDSTRSP